MDQLNDPDQALFLSHSDMDATGKSYYGETNLYLVSLDGSFDGMVELGEPEHKVHRIIAENYTDKEGPIYDFDWSPASREFVVSYGCMLLI
jgi:translation initiation factor 2A